jgi:hypothetical protein
MAKLHCDIYDSKEHLTSKCPILKQPRLLAHPCGYDVSGLGFYHVPHAPYTLGKTNNTRVLVTVQGGELSTPQLVAELGRLIPEIWLWNVTQQDMNSFVLAFPSRGDLQRSVAFGKAEIKEHGVSLLFEEWKQQEEEGHPLQRVWIRIFRLPHKLREFSVLWALGSMLGATQVVDMITSLKKDYARVEVAVLSVELLHNMIDTVVIGDRMFSLPIQVEGRDDMVEGQELMNMDNGHDGAPHGQDNADLEPDVQQLPQGNEAKNISEGSAQGGNSSQEGKQAVDKTQNKASKPCKVHGTVFNVLCSGQYPVKGRGGNTNSNALVSDKPKAFAQTGTGQYGMSHVVSGKPQSLLYEVPEFSTGNSSYSNQKTKGPHIETSILHSVHASSLPIIENTAAKSVTTLTRVQGNKDNATMFQELDTFTPVKRSKRREGSVDEDSSTRAERLKAKRNLDPPGMSTSKSFLSFSDDKIVTGITSLGISLGNEVDKGLENIKNLEHNRLLEASKTDLNKDKQDCSDEDDASESDSDIDLDQRAI